MSTTELHQAPQAPRQGRIGTSAFAEAQPYGQVDDVNALAWRRRANPRQALPEGSSRVPSFMAFLSIIGGKGALVDTDPSTGPNGSEGNPGQAQ